MVNNWLLYLDASRGFSYAPICERTNKYRYATQLDQASDLVIDDCLSGYRGGCCAE